MHRTRRLLAAVALFGCAHARTDSGPARPPTNAPAASAVLAPPPAPASNTGAVTGEDAVPGEAPRAESPPAMPTIPETGHPFQAPLPPRELDKESSARRVANLAPADCTKELTRRALPVERDRGPAEGIAVPVRITGELGGVRFVSPGRKSVYGKLDCRLVLALEELAKVLRRHGVVTVRVDNLYRPRARLAGRRTSSQHRYGLAIDLVAMQREDGVELLVERDWRGVPDAPPCGPDARIAEPTEQAVALRDVVCDAARSGIFHHLLTPSYDDAHRDHLHLDIKRGEQRWLVE